MTKQVQRQGDMMMKTTRRPNLLIAVALVCALTVAAHAADGKKEKEQQEVRAWRRTPFNSGWQFGGQSTAALKTEDKGGAMAGAASVSDGVWMYQLTDKGLAVEITAKSTKYYKDDDLN
jgi:hypothetical protein